MQYDTLTGLLSKQDFHDTCEKYIKEGSKKLVLISSDVSNFKYINEFYGRDTGDEFIKTMADYFYKDNPRCLAACRKGSDQFRGLYDLGDFSHDRELERIVDMNTAFEDMMNKKAFTLSPIHQKILTLLLTVFILQKSRQKGSLM